MKKFWLVLAVFTVLGSFLLTGTAEAVYFEITAPIFTVDYSPDSLVAPPYIGDSTKWVNLGPSGSVTIGFPTAEGASQPIGTYGVGLSLAPLGSVPGYNLAFDRHFATYDSSDYDTFNAVITEDDYLWDGGLLVGGYTWGGADFPGLEFGFGGWEKQATVLVTPGEDYYLNVVLVTTSDTEWPSWGTFSDVSVEAVPEPSSMLLFGMGILGLFGLGRKKKT